MLFQQKFLWAHISTFCDIYSLCFLKLGITPDENILTLWSLLSGKVVCAFINGSYYNLSGYKFTKFFGHYSFGGRAHASGKFVEIPTEIKHRLLYIFGPVSPESLIQSCFLLLFPRDLNSWWRKGKMRWRIGKIKHCVENCDWALQETFVWLKHLRIQALFSFLIYNDSRGPQMSHALHAPPRLSFCDSPHSGRNIAHRIQSELGFLENWLLEGKNRVSTSKYNPKNLTNWTWVSVLLTIIYCMLIVTRWNTLNTWIKSQFLSSSSNSLDDFILRNEEVGVIHCPTNDQFTHLCKESVLAWLSLPRGNDLFLHCQGDHWAYGECSCSENVDGGANLIQRYCFESRATFIYHK